MNNLSKSLAVFNWASQKAEKDLLHTETNKKLQDTYKIEDEIGRGAFGIVKKCESTTDKAIFAIKIILYNDAKLLKDIEREVEMMRKVNEHEHIVTLYGTYKCKGSFGMVMDYIAGGELFQRIIEKEYIEEKETVEYLRQLIEGLEYIHSKNIVHLDIKPENILCVDTTSNRIKLIDFGLARELVPGEVTRCALGTPDFVAPEAISFNQIKTQTDMWSTGVLTYVLISGLMPFAGDTDCETLCNISNVDWEFDEDSFEEISSDAKDFIEKLLVLNPDDRLSSSEALRHPWMKVVGEQRSGKINTKRHRTFLARRRWKKSVHVIMAVTKLCRLLQFSTKGGSGSRIQMNESSSPDGTLAVKLQVENENNVKTIAVATKSGNPGVDVVEIKNGPTDVNANNFKMCDGSCGIAEIPVLEQKKTLQRNDVQLESKLTSDVAFASSAGDGKKIMWKVMK